MIGLVMILHAIVCALLGFIILMQSGRGGGLTESFSSAESLFGAKTNAFLVKSTTVLCVLFFVSCLGLAVLSAQQGKSLMVDKPMPATTQIPVSPDDLFDVPPLEPAAVGSEAQAE